MTTGRATREIFQTGLQVALLHSARIQHTNTLIQFQLVLLPVSTGSELCEPN